ncbi:hypothetical protein SAMN05660464_1172 [Geodermatophilus dictyosporus]|uniref:Uncharacterized protein n=1 Tax=Geodermatophilus dictyosporus TaxID=1523247 RepID=A0A1I5K056_9ACTN|nr:hypothetical protein [Geodermatophilus dictyosporus]SFO78445.1 hypothetical protein SAMN05660464_1172 [Geodermatophilus dictyosporus]
MDVPQLLADVGDWAFDRHADVLSWYVRPLFLVPLAWFAHRRSGWGIAGTLVALASSTSWFPAPAQPDPRVLEFLDFEREWLTGPWDLREVGQSLLAPLTLGAYCLAFWRRSVGWGLVLLDLMAGGKLLWGVVVGNGTGWAMTVPALVGLLVCDAAVLWGVRRARARRAHPAVEPPVPPVRSSSSSEPAGTTP